MRDVVSPEFARLVEALGPYREKLVVAGAWAQRLFVQHPLAGDLGFEPLGTKDADLALPLRSPSSESGSRNGARTPDFARSSRAIHRTGR